jgi:Flp pilus assembly protein TadD
MRLMTKPLLAADGLTVSKLSACAALLRLTLPVFWAALFQPAFGQMAAPAPPTSSSGSGNVLVYVVGPDGSPIHRSFDVTLTRAGILYTHSYQSTGDSGMTQFTQVPFAEYWITASAPGYKEGSAEVDVNGVQNTSTVSVAVEPTDDNSPTPPEAKGVMLAPKAKKEASAGISAMQAGHYDEARQHLEAAYKLAPGNPDVNDMLGELYIATKDYPKAEQCLRRALSLEPDNASANTDIGYLRVQQKDYAAAEGSLQSAITLAPQNWFPHWLLGISYLRQGKYEDARQQANAAITVSKGHAPDAQYLLGESQALLGQNKEAIDSLEKLVKESPDSSDVPAAKTLIANLKSPAPAAILPPNSGLTGAATAPSNPKTSK